MKNRNKRGKYTSLNRKVERVIGMALILMTFHWSYTGAINAETEELIQLAEQSSELRTDLRTLKADTEHKEHNISDEAYNRLRETGTFETIESPHNEEKTVTSEPVTPQGTLLTIDDLSKAEKEIIRRESSFRTHAKNPNSTAFGLWQGLIANRIKYADKFGFDPHTVNEHEQLTMFRAYVKDRYQTAEKALEFHNQKGYY